MDDGEKSSEGGSLNLEPAPCKFSRRRTGEFGKFRVRRIAEDTRKSPVIFAEFVGDGNCDAGNSRAAHKISHCPSFGGLVATGFRSTRGGALDAEEEVATSFAVIQCNRRRLISHADETEKRIGGHGCGDANLHGGMQDFHCVAKERAKTRMGEFRSHFGYDTMRRRGHWVPGASPRAMHGFERRYSDVQ